MGIPKGEEKGAKELFEVIMTKNFPKLMTHKLTDPGN